MPPFGGVASRVINTVQEVCRVIARAAAGALLQNRLATALHEQAAQRALARPDAFRGHFVDAFNSAGGGGLWTLPRALKPSIPTFGEHGIDDDGLELEFLL